MIRALINGRSSLSLSTRFLSAAAPAAKKPVDKEALKRLRQNTGYSFVNCKKALDQFGPNALDDAEKWLHELAKKEGWAKAQKVSSRQTTQGLVGVSVSDGYGAVVELSCETDFVARGEPFKQLLSDLTNAVLAHAKKQQWENSGRLVTLSPVFDDLSDAQGRTLRSILTDSVGRLGENLTVKSLHIYKVPEGFNFYAATHPKDGSISNVSMGRYASLLVMKRLAPESSVFPSEKLADQICQHIIGMKSESLGEPPLPKTEKKEEEKKFESEEDELNEFFTGKTTSIDDSETSLFRQAFMLNPSQTVYDYLQGHKAEVIDFARVELSGAGSS